MPQPLDHPSRDVAPLDPLRREAQDRFIALWGQMGAAWGIRRTMAEVHALLFISGQPMNADEVVGRLGISRGNASMALRALLDWGVVSREHQRGDRREYFTAEQDVWKLFRTVLRERKKREIDPLIEALRACRDMTLVPARGVERAAVDEHNARLDQLIEFMQIVDSISQRFISPAGQGLQQAAQLLARAS